MPPAQLLLLTQGLSTLGGENASFAKVLDGWAGLDESKGQLTSDQLAKLAQSVAPVAAGQTAFWDFICTQLASKTDSLTEAGWASVEAAFPGGAGPECKDKEKLLAALKTKKDKEDEKKKREEEDKKRADDRNRRDTRGNDRRDDRRDDRGRDDRR